MGTRDEMGGVKDDTIPTCRTRMTHFIEMGNKWRGSDLRARRRAQI